MKQAYLALIAFATTSSIPLGAQQPNSDDNLRSDQAVSRAAAAEDMVRQFERVDRNRDGSVSLEEWRASGPAGDSYSEELRRIFSKLDADRNNLVSKQELVDWGLALFDCMDANRDGTLLEQESGSNAMLCLVEVGGFSPPPPPQSLETSQAPSSE